MIKKNLNFANVIDQKNEFCFQPLKGSLLAMKDVEFNDSIERHT